MSPFIVSKKFSYIESLLVVFISKLDLIPIGTTYGTDLGISKYTYVTKFHPYDFYSRPVGIVI